MEEFLRQYASHDFNVIGSSSDAECVKVEDRDTGTVDVYKRIDGAYVWYGYAKNWDSADMNILNF